MSQSQNSCRVCGRIFKNVGWLHRHEREKHYEQVEAILSQRSDAPEPLTHSQLLPSQPDENLEDSLTEQETLGTREEAFSDAGRPIRVNPDHQKLLENPYYPFRNIQDYRLAAWFI